MLLPLVTILIATKDRPDDLRQTLREMRRQDYPSMEMLIVDDGSTSTDLTTIVRDEWPSARFVRRVESRGQSQRRTEGFGMVRGEYILQLDDDSGPVRVGDLRSAVSFLMARPEVGVLSFHIFNGQSLPLQVGIPEPRYVVSFVGCGALFRTAAVQEVGGYQAFFGNEWEEEELSLRMVKAGWAVYFFPHVLIHHRVSSQNRRTPQTWMRGFRNKLWAQVMHYPVRRLAVEASWVLSIALWDAVRLVRPRYFLLGVTQFVAGLPRALALREPMSVEALARYDALRFRKVGTEEEFRNPVGLGWSDFRVWYEAWKTRPRQRSVWDRREGDIGRSETVTFSHEYRADATTQDRNDD